MHDKVVEKCSCVCRFNVRYRVMRANEIAVVRMVMTV